MTESKTKSNTKPETTEWATDEQYDGLPIRTLSTISKGLLTGLIGGMAAFTYRQSDLMTVSINPQYILLLLALAGAFAHILAYDLRESIRTGLLGFFFGGITMALAWISPLWLLSYSGGARDILLTKLLGNAVGDMILIYMVVFFGSYLLALIIGAYVSS